MCTCFSEGFQHYCAVVSVSWRQGFAEQVYLLSMLSLSGQHDFIQGGITGLVMESQCSFSKASLAGKLQVFLRNPWSNEVTPGKSKELENAVGVFF